MTIAKTSLLSLVNKCLSKLGLEQIYQITNISEGINFEIIESIKFAVQDVYSEMGWKFLEEENATITTTSGTRAYLIPDEVRSIKRILIANHATPGSATIVTPLIEMAEADYVYSQTMKPDTSYPSTGLPTHYAIFNGKIQLKPVPDTNDSDGYSLLIECVKNVDFNSLTGSSTFLIPYNNEEIIIAAALMRVKHEGNDQGYWAALQSKLLRSMRSANLAQKKYRLSL